MMRRDGLTRVDVYNPVRDVAVSNKTNRQYFVRAIGMLNPFFLTLSGPVRPHGGSAGRRCARKRHEGSLLRKRCGMAEDRWAVWEGHSPPNPQMKGPLFFPLGADVTVSAVIYAVRVMVG